MELCVKCLEEKVVKKGVHKHHMLSQTAKYKSLYPDFINDPRNIKYLCVDHHLNKSLDKLSELDFCRMMKIMPRSKSLQSKIMQNKIDKFWED